MDQCYDDNILIIKVGDRFVRLSMQILQRYVSSLVNNTPNSSHVLVNLLEELSFFNYKLREKVPQWCAKFNIQQVLIDPVKLLEEFKHKLN